jgi:hypothetical protein
MVIDYLLTAILFMHDPLHVISGLAAGWIMPRRLWALLTVPTLTAVIRIATPAFHNAVGYQPMPYGMAGLFICLLITITISTMLGYELRRWLWPRAV